MIPKVIYMCDKETTFIEKYSKNWLKLNPEFEVKLYDNVACENFLTTEFSPLHCEVFQYIKDGPIKADFWRVCVLYKYGGYYVDADVEPLVPIREFIDEEADFVICTSLYFFKALDPIFMVAEAGNKTLYNCIMVYIKHFNNKFLYSYMTWSIVTIMKYSNVLKIKSLKKKFGIYNVDDSYKVQILQEVNGENSYDDHVIYNNIRLFNNRYKTYDEKNHKFIS